MLADLYWEVRGMISAFFGGVLFAIVLVLDVAGLFDDLEKIVMFLSRLQKIQWKIIQ